MANGRTETGDIREALLWGAGTHPLDQSHLYVSRPLYEWQADVLRAAARPKSRVVFSTANESGKTSVILPVFGLSCMSAFPGCQVLSTSGDERQVREQLFEQQLKPLVEQERFKRSGWDISTSQLKVTAPNGSTWLGYVAQKDTTFEGFHGYWSKKDRNIYCPLIFLVDEAKSTRDGIHQAIRRIDPDFWITCSTPGVANGWFYEAVDEDTLRAKSDV